jgi:hypothetical protein
MWTADMGLCADALVGFATGFAFFVILQKQITRGITLVIVSGFFTWYIARMDCPEPEHMFIQLLSWSNDFLKMVAAHPIAAAGYPFGVTIAKKLF